MLGKATHLMRFFAGTKLMLRNLPWTATKDEIINSVKALAAYEKLDLPVNLDGRNRGFAFVTFTTEAEKEKATPALGNLEIQGRKVSVHEYVERPPGERPPRTGGFQRRDGYDRPDFQRGGGYSRGGDFRGGDFRGGDSRGGDFRGGDFRGGDFRGERTGNFRGGYRPREPRPDDLPPRDMPPSDEPKN